MLISNKEMEIKTSVSKIESLTEQRIFLVDPFQDEKGVVGGWGGGPLASFSHVTPTPVGFRPKGFLTFRFEHIFTLVQDSSY